MGIHSRFRIFPFDGNSTEVCPPEPAAVFLGKMDLKIFQSNCLMLINVFLMSFMVLIGTFAPRLRHHPVFALILVLASTSFLPIVTEVAATINDDAYFISYFTVGDQIVAGLCVPTAHVALVFVWTATVVAIGVNTSIIVVGDPREGRNAEPPTELLVKAGWVVYLAFTVFLTGTFFSSARLLRDDIRFNNDKTMVTLFLVSLTALVFLPFLKIVVKLAARYSAGGSVVFGRNPRLVAGYMAYHDLSCETQAKDDVPEVLVRGEEYYELEEKALGYMFKHWPGRERIESEWNKLVTLNKVWGDLDDTDRMESTQIAKDLCFSFALSKMLRCRFAKYTVSRAGFIKVSKFFRRQYLQPSNVDVHPERVFRVIADELSFIHDYYSSPVHIFYSNAWVGTLNIFVSLLSIGCVLCASVLLSRVMRPLMGASQTECTMWCPGVDGHVPDSQEGVGTGTFVGFGDIYFDQVPVVLVLVMLFISEVKLLVTYVCSKWVKVALICSYVKHTAYWRQCPAVWKCIAFILDPDRCKLFFSKTCLARSRKLKLKLPWSNHGVADEMKQCSLLPRPVLAGLPNKRSIKVPEQVKKAILEVLKSLAAADPANDQATHPANDQYIRPPSPPTTASEDSGGKPDDVASSILAWHVATSLLDLMSHDPQQPPVDDRLTATALSRYCAYLVAESPELLPVDAKWCKKLYKNAKKEAGNVLRSRKKDSVIDSLKESSNGSTVLRVGATLAEELLKEDSSMSWQKLSRFWSEMILYIAPSESLDAHADAIARGGELITLLWALLLQAGIVDRLPLPADTTAGASFSDHP